MTLKYGVASHYYGKTSCVHAELMRDLAHHDTAILELHGSPYPEMTFAEHARRAAQSDLDVIVILDPQVTTSRWDIETLAHAALRGGNVCLANPSTGLGFAAIPTAVLRLMIDNESRRYKNSAVQSLFRDEKKEIVSAVPLASPFTPSGEPLVPGRYLDPDDAFLLRAQAVTGVERVPVFCQPRRPSSYSYSRNADKPINDEPGSQFALCIPRFGGVDVDQLRAIYSLEKAGMMILEYEGSNHIDQVRSWLCERALETGRGVFFLDHDIIFAANDVLRLCEQALERNGVVAAAYCMRKSGRNFIGAIDQPPGPLEFYERGATVPAYYSGLGFAAVPKALLESMALPKLSSSTLGLIRPWFALDCSTGFYSGEDVSFCNRVHGLDVQEIETNTAEPDWRIRRTNGAPARVFIDTRVRISHRGNYDYMLEDAGCAVPCMTRMVALLTPSMSEARGMLRNAYEQFPVDVRLQALEGYSQPLPESAPATSETEPTAFCQY